jgi:predicted PurR-regulated permease PerM
MEPRSTKVINLLPAVALGFALYVLLGALNTLSQALLLIALSVILAASMNPAVIWLNARLKMPRALGAALILFVVLGGIALLVGALVPAVVAQLTALIAGVPSTARAVQEWLVNSSAANPVLRSFTDSLQTADLAQQLQGLLSAIPNTLLSAVGATGNVLNGAILALLLLLMGFTVLIQPEPLIKGTLAAVPLRYRDEVSRALSRIGRQLSAWILSTLLLSFLLGLAYFVALGILGFFGVRVGNIFLFSVIAGVTNFIPVVGPIFGLLPPVLSALAPVPANALWVAGVLFAVNFLVLNIASPIILARGVSLHPATSLGGVLVFSALFGVIGAFLAVPFAIVIKAIYEDIYLPLVNAAPVTDADVTRVVHGQTLEARLDDGSLELPKTDRSHQ